MRRVLWAVLLYGAGTAQADFGDQIAKLVPEDPLAWNRFGYAVAIDGDIAIVGQVSNEGIGGTTGSAHLYSGATGEWLATLLPEDGYDDDSFGVPVAIDGGLAIVGAHGDDDLGSAAGAAYIFDANTYQQIVKLRADDGHSFDLFGRAVAISNGIAVVGAPQDDDNGSSSGSAYLFDAVTGAQRAKLVPSDGGYEQYAGSSVAIDGEIAVVGSWSPSSIGAVHVFDVATGEELAKLLPEDAEQGDRFGFSVGVCDGVVVVGASGDDDHGDASGSAYLFEATTGEQLAKLLPDDGAADDFFGESVAISGTMVLVGGEGDDDAGPFTGSAYLFDATTGEQLAKLLPDDASGLSYFGLSAGLAGGVAIVGAPGVAQDSGAAYLFDVSDCPIDLNADGELNILDFVTFQLLWQGSDAAADCDANGVLDQLDFVCFQQLFAEGCG